MAKGVTTLSSGIYGETGTPWRYTQTSMMYHQPRRAAVMRFLTHSGGSVSGLSGLGSASYGQGSAVASVLGVRAEALRLARHRRVGKTLHNSGLSGYGALGDAASKETREGGPVPSTTTAARTSGGSSNSWVNTLSQAADVYLQIEQAKAAGKQAANSPTVIYQQSSGPSTTMLVGGAAVLGLLAYLVLRK